MKMFSSQTRVLRSRKSKSQIEFFFFFLNISKYSKNKYINKSNLNLLIE
jgi:hypothetical protein